MIKNLLSDDDPVPQAEPKQATTGRREGVLINLFETETTDDDSGTATQPAPYDPRTEPETLAENVRRSGLAWSAGVAFFAAVVFMMILGWGADVLLGTSPWGIVGGIILGSVIGFVQFFRLTSQIFKK